MEKIILDILACPQCRQRLVENRKGLQCSHNHFYKVKNGVPVMTKLDAYLKKEAEAWEDEWKKGVSKEALFSYEYNLKIFKKLGYWEESGSAASIIPSKNDWNVLDVGCGNGYSTSSLKGKLVVGVDLSEEQMARAAKKYKKSSFLVGDINKLPFKSNSFNLVVAINIFHHIDSPNRAIKEIYRVLKKGGILLSVDPNLYNPIGFVGRGLYKLLNLKKIFPTFPQFALGDEEKQFSKTQYYNIYENSPFNKYVIKPHRIERLLFFATIIFPFLSRIPGYDKVLIIVSKIGEWFVKQKPFDRICYFWIGEARK